VLVCRWPHAIVCSIARAWAACVRPRHTAEMSDPEQILRVTCLCADWCGVCRDYAQLFDQTAEEFGAPCEFAWIDIEDRADLLDGVDVENFPTLLMSRGGEVLFFGTITPHAQTLSRLVQSALAGELGSSAVDPAIEALVKRMTA
jgi:thioredoxin 1